MPADPATIAQLRAALRVARVAIYTLGEQRRAELLHNRPTGQYAAPIAAARTTLRAARAALHEAQTS